MTRLPFPRPSAATVDQIRSALDREIGGSKVLHGEESLARYAGDESEQEPVLPDAVVLAESADDVCKALAVASDLGVPLTPRAAGTGKSGGAVPVAGGIVVCTLGMKAIKEIDRGELLAVVEPGVILGDLYAAVESEGLFYPPDPNSWRDCAIGGNIAENAAGPRAVKYGVTRDYVLGLEVVSGAGQRLRTGRRTPKGVTGYDLTALLTGSEGTLALTVEATLRLRRKPEHVITTMALFADVEEAVKAVSAVLGSGLVPRCLEMTDGTCVGLMRDEGLALDPRAGAMLIIEVDGDVARCEADLERLGGELDAAGAMAVLVAQDEAQRARLWATRNELSNIVRKQAKHKISEDVVVQRRDLPALVRLVNAMSERTGVKMLSYGHAGDGNLHVNLLWDEEEQLARVEGALDELFRAVVSMGGTLSGEHGIGTSKSAFLALEQSRELIELQRSIKGVFDPAGILNPGKIFPRGGHGAC